jgi:hypothetical protein
VAETTCLLNMRTGKLVPGVRIPLSPQGLNPSRYFGRDFLFLVSRTCSGEAGNEKDQRAKRARI